MQTCVALHADRFSYLTEGFPPSWVVGLPVAAQTLCVGLVVSSVIYRVAFGLLINLIMHRIDRFPVDHVRERDQGRTCQFHSGASARKGMKAGVCGVCSLIACSSSWIIIGESQC